MTNLIVNIVIKLAKTLYEWSQTEEGQTRLRKFFVVIRRAWNLPDLQNREGK